MWLWRLSIAFLCLRGHKLQVPPLGASAPPLRWHSEISTAQLGMMVAEGGESRRKSIAITSAEGGSACPQGLADGLGIG